MRRDTFDEFVFDHDTLELWHGGRRVPLEPQPARALAALITASGKIVERSELEALLWRGSGTHVNYRDGLNYCVRQLRIALADDARRPRFIETLPRRGYRFLATVEPGRRGRGPRLGTRLLPFAAAAAVSAMLIALAESRPNSHHEIAVTIVRAVHDAIF
jgi:DNA-binding winged helix-turn-helix (wHTH) protein